MFKIAFCMFLLFLVEQQFCHESSHENKQNCDFSKKIISAAMIADMYPHHTDPGKLRYYNYDLNFTREVFRTADPPIQWFFAPPVFSKGCYDQSMTNFAPRGGNIAHKEVWDHFVRFRKSCADVLIVFENDAVEGLPDNQAGMKLTAHCNFVLCVAPLFCDQYQLSQASWPLNMRGT